ncbi:hypothetical protein ACG7TL_000890 [Trametes sanguinea]
MVTTAMALQSAYYYLITHYLDLTVFARGDVWTAPSINNLVSESFFARRVYMVGRQYVIVVISAWIINVASVLLLLGDVQLTVVLVYALHRCRSGIRRTDSMVDILIAYAISSGSLICVINLATLILSFIFPHDPIFSAASLVSQGVYTNSFVVALNTRQFVRSRGELDDTNLDSAFVLGEKAPSGTAINRVELPLTSMVFAAGPSQSQLSKAASGSGDMEEGSIGQSSKTRTQAIDEDKDKEHIDVEADSV